MNTRLPLCLMFLLVALPLALAGCGNSGPLVMPDAAPAAGTDAEPEVDTDQVVPVDDDAPAQDAIPDDTDTDDGNG
ncbi:MAG TPA: lipoprotein [Lysobacter sp.]|nr:lipoprotein [Lysobacter sp.]